jgi:ABC-type multidrug transport system fused ATPase/permease subunit
MNFFEKVFLISKNFKKETFNLLILSFFAMIFEILGVGIIFPAISLLSGSEIFIFDRNLEDFLINLPFFINLSLEVIVFIFLFLIFLFKFIFFSFFIFYQAKIKAHLSTKISSDLYTKYLYSDYTFYFLRSTSELMRNVLGEANNFLKRIFFPILQIFMDCLILAGILSIIFFIDPKSSLFLIIIYSSFSLIYFFSIKKKLNSIGEQQLEFDKFRIKSSQEGFQGIKTIKIFFIEKKFIKSFQYYYKTVANLIKSQSILQQIPKYAIELITIFSFIVICLFLLEKNSNFLEIVPTLALFVTAAVRILPTTNRLLSNNQLIRSGLPALDNLSNEINNLNIKIEKEETEELNFKSSIKIDNVSFHYNEKKNIFENIDLEIIKGETIGLIGKTGTGKTTFVDLILGLLKPKNGQLLIDGKKINTSARSWKNILGYVPQEIFLFEDSIKNNIILDNSKDIDKERYDEVLKISEVEEFLVDDKDREAGERGISLSGGQKQRIGIARALYKNPQILILDESTSSLDLNTERKIMESIYKLRGKNTIIIISHRESALNNCDKIYEIKNSKLIKIK